MSPSCAKGERPDVPIQAYSAEADKETCAGVLERTSLTSASAPHTTMHSFSSASPNSKRAKAAAAAAEGGNLVGRNVDPESAGIRLDLMSYGDPLARPPSSFRFRQPQLQFSVRRALLTGKNAVRCALSQQRRPRSFARRSRGSMAFACWRISSSSASSVHCK